MKRWNWPFVAIGVLAFLAVLSRLVLVRHYEVPRIIRHHLADFAFPALFTFAATCAVALMVRLFVRSSGLRRLQLWVYMLLPVLGTAWAIQVELEDLWQTDAEPGGFDLGFIISDWFGAPDTDTFDQMDIVAIVLGGLVAFCLQVWSLKRKDQWYRTPLRLAQPPTP